MKRRHRQNIGKTELFKFRGDEEGHLALKRILFLKNYIRNSKTIPDQSCFVFLHGHLSVAGRRRLVEEFSEELDAEVIVKFVENEEDFAGVFESLSKYPSTRRKVCQRVVAEMDETINSMKKRAKGDIFASRLAELGEMFKLDNLDLDLIAALFLMGSDDEFDDMFFNGSYRKLGSKLHVLRCLVGGSPAKLSAKLARDGAMRKFGLIEEDLELEDHVIEFLHGMRNDALSSEYFREFRGEAIPIGSHGEASAHADVLIKIIENKGLDEGVNVLFHGPPGSGKTEFAHSLGRALSCETYEIKMTREGPRGGGNFRFAAFNACRNAVDSASSLVVVDEADEMLNGSGGFSLFGPTRNREKGIVNDLLDESNVAAVWITNSCAHIEDSTKRRFDYSIEFRNFDAAGRKRIWLNALRKHDLVGKIAESDIDVLTAEYEVSAGGIDVALRNFRRAAGDDETEGGALLRRFLEAHVNIVKWPRRRKVNRDANGTCYSLEGLNVSGAMPVGRALEVIRSFRSELLSNVAAMETRNMNILLHGPPGTGKTEFAKHVARELGAPLHVKRASDILSMWVGGTEANIRTAFEEAERERAVLLIDEVEGLIASREKSHRNWEVTQVNELLTQMEEFRGILVCATNFKERVDSAAIRRFNLKFKFDHLEDKGKERFYRLQLQGLVPKRASRTDMEMLKRIDHLTPADFKVVRQEFLYLSEEERSHDAFLNALRKEVENKNESKGGKMGFV